MPQITLDDISLNDYGPTDRVAHLRKIYFRAMPEICIERPRLITDYHRNYSLFDKDRISILHKAKCYRHVLENRTAIVRHSRSYEKGMSPFEFEDSSLFAGSTTSKFKGVPLYPEFLALSLWPELWSISKRAKNPFHITESEINYLNDNIFPYWMENNITEIARKRCFEENLKKHGLKKHAPELKLLERLVFFLATKANCISHTIPDFSKAIDKGLREIINEAGEKRDRTRTDSKKEFYTAISEVLEGIIAYSKNLAEAAKKRADTEADPTRKKELLEIAEIHFRVPEFPAQTFREGLTTVWICWTAIHLENPNVGLSLGRLDQVLYDLYRNDIDQKTLTVEAAIELICCLWLKIGDHVPAIPDAGEQLFGGTGSNQAITMGGVDKDGKDAVNDLTYVMLKATELMRLRDPNPNARYYPGVNKADYLKRLCDVNIKTGAIPAIHNDRAVIKALTEKGETDQQARDYGVIGCVEPGSNGRFYGHTAAILLNLTSVLELTLFNGRHRHTGLDVLISKETGDPTTITDFDQFKSAFREQTRWIVEQSTTLNHIFGKVHQDFYPTPILSALFEGPMEKGRDLIEGGATINASGAAIIGLADVADALSAIQQVVFNDKAVPYADLLDALKENFAGYEGLQKRLENLDKTPKFGNEDPLADANAAWILALLDETFGNVQNYRGGKYRVGCWTMTNHAGFGRLMGAMPNGRKAGENFSSGITPVSGACPVLTKALNSVAGLPATYLSNGAALNLKYTLENDDIQTMLNNFVASVAACFDDAHGKRDGPMEVQFNIINRSDLEELFRNPNPDSDLLVRVSGYTAYFKDLNPQMQREIIDRTEYVLSTGMMFRF